MENTIEIKHVSEFIQFVEQFGSRFKRNQHFYFRGESGINLLLPSLYRKIDNVSGPEVYISKSNERKILSEFMTEAAGYIDNISIDDIFRWVQYAQHFGVPTRLMDWTSNPLVALFFACSSNLEKDGKVYILNSLGYRLLLDADDINNMDGKLIREEARKMIWESEDTFPYPIPFKPYCFDVRMHSQSSLFLVWGSKKLPLDKLINELEATGKKKELVKYLCAHGVEVECAEELKTLSEISIKGIYKAQLRRELDSIGVNHAALFPGLDGIGKSVEWRNNRRNMS